MIILRNKYYSSREKLNKLGNDTNRDIRKAVKGSSVENKVRDILDKSTEEMKHEASKMYKKCECN